MEALAALILALGAPEARSAHVDFCPGFALAGRTGNPSCWARFTIDGERRLCVPRALWKRVLARKGVPACGRWRGRWRTSAVGEPVAPATAKIPRRSFRVMAPPEPREGSSAGEIAGAIERWRERTADHLEDADSLGLARRLLLDQRAPGGPEPVLRRVGFVHVATATGIHLYALHRILRAVLYTAGLAGGITAGRALWAARLIAFAAWLACWILAGFRPGFLRPWIVVVLREAARPLGLRWRLAAPLVAALSADLAVAGARALTGGAAWAPGRLHYALAVGGGLLAMDLARAGLAGGKPAPLRSALREHLGLSVGSWLATAPLDAWQEGTVALATPVLSLVTIPLLTLGAYPALLLGAAAGAAGLDLAASSLLHWGAGVVDGTLRASAAAVMAAPTLWIVPRWAVLGGAALASAAIRGARARALALALAAAVAAGLSLRPAHRSGVASGLLQLDVGQGDSALVMSGGGAGLIDVGPARGLGPDRWISILSKAGVTRLDWVALTHLDEDHAGALPWIAATAPIGCVATAPVQWRSARGGALRDAIEPLVPRFEDWRGGCFPFPAYVVPDARPGLPNSGMSALLVPLEGGGVYVNAGDAGFEAEGRVARWLLPRLRGPGPRILKASHHGSKHSSSAGFLAAVRPSEVWISCGLGNPHGHPAPAALERLGATGARIRRTDTEGPLYWTETATETETASSLEVFRRRRP